MSEKPIIGITMGDPASIGPEIAIKALLTEELYHICRPILIGNVEVFEQIIEKLSLPAVIHPIQHVEQAKYTFGHPDVYDLGKIDLNAIKFGEVSIAAGDAAFQSVKKVIELAMDGLLAATVTGPINKKSISEAGHAFPGHTEIYAHYTGTKKYAMLLVEEQMRVIHVSTHVSLREACDLVKKDRILEVIELLHNGLLSLGVENLKIGVAGLNPHAGDSGLFGTEDDQEIAPAVVEARKLGYDVEGPVPADTLFSKAATGYYGGIVAMYHDQGHIPFKLTGFKWNSEKQQMDSVKGVNITMGLPIIRTSVDHGTAFEIAGKGIASHDAMLLAIKAATQLALNKVKK
ncbi:4-hydroxythreonine-4-phosphate dehydrogenase PdxA [Olivibacter domesticus]|uniref:4-hydroxythreonine-4-phosphate dehydrogenase n=1 Tax=Olivibacter domesticus TaxID=407022 RepID=A0A1H7H6A1_OLID1|nr:4-hydroxythreonine-4-phosphate dehydrogenase PdxA [Olivibacter domesticus]SEK45821.1 4-hydroxythreonine-4-phosphate dehydrogenase [Olivibacter domesticus]